MSLKLGAGEIGQISFTRITSKSVTAECYIRDYAGKRRHVQATAKTKAAAKRKINEKIEMVLSSSEEIEKGTKFEAAAKDWEQYFSTLAQKGVRSPTTYDTYMFHLHKNIIPVFEKKTLEYITTGMIYEFIQEIDAKVGYASAKLCRTVISSVFALQVRKDKIKR